MPNCPRLRLVGLLLLSATAPRESFAAPPSPPNSSVSLTSEPLLDPVILRMLDRVDTNRISADIQTLVAFGTRNTCSDNSGASPGIGAARDWIRNRYLSIPGLQVRLVPWTMEDCGDGTTRTLHDVIAWIPGRGHPNRLIVIGGHYDSRTTNPLDGISPAPGANDSGSQTALVLEAARVMAGHRFDATVVFADWSGEEQGLLGSKYFVQHCLNYFPNGTLELNLNSDDVGGDNVVNDATTLQQFDLYSPGTPREFGFTPNGSTDDTSPSRGVMRQIGYWGSAYVPSMMMLPQLRESPPGRRSDQTAFIASGIPGVRFRQVNMNPPHRHSPYDLYIYVTPAFTARLCQVVVASAASLARAPTPPLNMVAKGTSLGTVQLTWSPPVSGSAVDHYVISARTTAENLYRTRTAVSGDLTSATVDVFQDLGIPRATAYFVSIAAVDAAGHESLYAYPEYRCDSKNRCSQPANALNVTAIAPSTPAVRGLSYNGGTPFVNGTNLTKGKSYTVTAQTNSTTQSVVFSRDGSVVFGTDSASPFSFTWTPTLIGTHTFTATPWSSTEGKGTRGTSITVSYTTVSAQ
jgi:Peptidase family M28/Bacterial Ig domain